MINEQGQDLKLVFLYKGEEQMKELRLRKVHCVGGYEFPCGETFCQASHKILTACHRKGAAVWSVDDGPHPEVDELRKAAGEYFYFTQLGPHKYMIVDMDEFNVEV
jgi:hypothetical protein